MKAMVLRSNITGKVLEVVNRLSPMDRSDYDTVKLELLEHFQLTEDGYRRKFRNAKPEKQESPRQYAGRLKGYMQKWVMMSGIDETYDSLMDLILQEQFVNNCPRGVEVFIKEGQCDSLEQVIERATVYVGAHGPNSFSQSPRPGGFRPTGTGPPRQGNVNPSQSMGERAPSRGLESHRPNSNPSTSSTMRGKSQDMGARTAFGSRGCYMCGNPGHIKRFCPLRRKTHAAQGMMNVDELSTNHDSQAASGEGRASSEIAGNQDTNPIGRLRSMDSVDLTSD